MQDTRSGVSGKNFEGIFELADFRIFEFEGRGSSDESTGKKSRIAEEVNCPTLPRRWEGWATRPEVRGFSHSRNFEFESQSRIF
jgi:hypothetical protein